MAIDKETETGSHVVRGRSVLGAPSASQRNHCHMEHLKFAGMQTWKSTFSDSIEHEPRTRPQKCALIRAFRHPKRADR